MNDTPIQTLHYKAIVLLADCHEKRSHTTLNPKPIQKLLFVLILVVEGISDKIGAALNVQFISELVLMLFVFLVIIMSVNAHSKELNCKVFN